MFTGIRHHSLNQRIAVRILVLAVLTLLSYSIDPNWVTVVVILLLGALSSSIPLCCQTILSLVYFISGCVIPLFFPVFLDIQETLYPVVLTSVYLIFHLLGRPLFIQISRYNKYSPFLAGTLSLFALCLFIFSLSRKYDLSYLCWAFLLLIAAQHFRRDNLFRLTQVVPGILVALIIMFTVLESGSRLLMPTGSNPGGLYVTDEDAIFTLRPDGEGIYYFKDNSQSVSEWRVTLSSQGIRDKEYGPKAPDEFRIITLGDSYTMGHCLKREETFQYELEKLLNNERMAKRVTVINCGVGGYAPWQERIFLQKRGLGFDPDLVLLQLFPANDVSGSYTQAGKYLHAFDIGWELKVIDFRRQQEFPFYLERWCQRHSNLYRFLCSEYGREGFIRDCTLQFRFIPKTEYMPPVIKCPREGKYETCLQTWYPELWEAWTIFKGSICGIQDDCRRQGINLVVFAHRDYPSLRQEFWDDLNRNFPDSPYEANKDIRLIKEMLTELDIPYADVHKDFMAYPNPEDLYYLYDGHFAPQGAKVLAKCLHDFLMTAFFAPNRERIPS